MRGILFLELWPTCQRNTAPPPMHPHADTIHIDPCIHRHGP